MSGCSETVALQVTRLNRLRQVLAALFCFSSHSAQRETSVFSHSLRKSQTGFGSEKYHTPMSSCCKDWECIPNYCNLSVQFGCYLVLHRHLFITKIIKIIMKLLLVGAELFWSRHRVRSFLHCADHSGDAYQSANRQSYFALHPCVPCCSSLPQFAICITVLLTCFIK